MFFRIFQHLLPNARAWRLTAVKQLREFFEGLTAPLGDDSKTFFDQIFNDIDPQLTRELTAWETQFGLKNTGLTTQERRDRIDATWKALGGQDPRYIEDTLQANGFDVYVHEWYDPGSEAAVNVKACATPRNPTTWLIDSSGSIFYLTGLGEVLAECGEAIMECGERISPPGYLLANKITYTSRDLISTLGEAIMRCGEIEAICGNYSVLNTKTVEYIIPTDVTKWPYFLYIGGQIFGELAQVDPKRKDEFETLCLKLRPAQQWLGMIVEYV